MPNPTAPVLSSLLSLALSRWSWVITFPICLIALRYKPLDPCEARDASNAHLLRISKPHVPLTGVSTFSLAW